MMPKKIIPSIFALLLCLLFTQCEKEELLIADNQAEALVNDALHPGSMKGGKPSGETAGNNLSFPVIWAEGIQKTLPGTFGMTPELQGEYWYQWGTNGVDHEATPASCPADPDEGNLVLNPAELPLCDDGVDGAVNLLLVAGTEVADNPEPLVKAFIQKDNLNTWQALSGDPVAMGLPAVLEVDWLDWGDNLESVDWYTRSQVRTEVVLFQDNLNPSVPWLEYQMRHTDGWGINEVHGLAATLDDEPVALEGLGTQATVYSPSARFMIQKLNVDRDDPRLADLIWVPGPPLEGGGGGGWTEPEGYPDDLINPPIFNMAVHEAADGPGYYNAEINVKGRIIYGYTWNVRKLNEGASDYRLTFSFDTEEFSGIPLNTFFVDGVTEIMLPEEEEILAIAAEEGESPGGGAEGILDFEHNLTYMDIRILERSGGGGGGGGKPSGGGGGGGGHGGGHN